MCARSGAVCAYVALLYILAVNGCPDNRIIRYYKELGCSPVPVNSNCPTSFDCGEWDKQDIEKCWLKGKQYNIGEDVRPLDEPCVHECSCRVDGKRVTILTFKCKEISRTLDGAASNVASQESEKGRRTVLVEKRARSSKLGSENRN